jgi:hypothetical protein
VHDLAVKNDARGFRTLTSNVIQALTEKVKLTTLDPAEERHYSEEVRDVWQPLADVPGITSPLTLPAKKQNLDQLIRNLERNVANLHTARDYKNDEVEVKVEPTLRQ